MLTRLLRLLAPSHPGATPACSPSFVGAGFNRPLPARTPPPHPLTTSAHPASSAPPCRPLEAPTFVANRQKTGPSYLSPARIPYGDSGWREIAPPSPPPNSRRPAPALSFVRPPRLPVAVPVRAARRPAQASPHRPGKTRPPAPRCPTEPHPGPSVAGRGRRVPASAKDAPPRLKSFLKKLLLRARPPLAPLRTAPLSSPSQHPTAPPVYTGRDRPSLGAGVTANLNPTGAPRNSARGPASGRYHVPGVERVQLSARHRRLRDRLIVVFTSLGNSIGEGLQSLVDQLPIGL